MPEPARLLDLTRRLGSPIEDAILPGAAPPPGPVERERALLMLVGDGFYVRSGSAPDGQPELPMVVRERGVETTAGECLEVKRTADSGTLEISAPSDAWLEVELRDGGKGAALIGHEQAPSSRTRQRFETNAGERVSIHVPSIGDSSDWRVGLELDAPTACIRTFTNRPDAAAH
jgi:hypothetical protein